MSIINNLRQVSEMTRNANLPQAYKLVEDVLTMLEGRPNVQPPKSSPNESRLLEEIRLQGIDWGTHKVRLCSLYYSNQLTNYKAGRPMKNIKITLPDGEWMIVSPEYISGCINRDPSIVTKNGGIARTGQSYDWIYLPWHPRQECI